MDNRWAVIIGTATVGAIVWWYAGHPGYETREQRQARIAEIERGEGSSGPLLYRCPGPGGVNTITDTPPPGAKCTVVKIRDDQNVVTLPAAPETPEHKRARERRKKR